MALTLDGTNGIVSSGSITTQSATGVIFSDSSSLPAASSPYVLKNRIINGDMVIDQRNAGASITPVTNQYLVDRYITQLSQASKFTVQQVSANANTSQGFQQSLRVTSSSAYSVLTGDFFTIQQRIEGYNVADLAWGTASAKTITLSFWVYSSLTGTFGGAINNADNTRAYPFSYTISSANTWTKASITIAGDTSGTWNTTNGIGLNVYWGLGVGSTYSGTAGSWSGTTYLSSTGATSVVGTSGATWYLTGVQLEIGSTATPFERRLYDKELISCQRYFNTSYFGSGSAVGAATTTNQVAWIAQSTGNYNGIALTLPVQMRVAPAITTYSGLNGSSGNMNTTSTTISAAALTASTTSFNVFANNVATSYSANLYFHYTASAEL